MPCFTRSTDQDMPGQIGKHERRSDSDLAEIEHIEEKVLQQSTNAMEVNHASRLLERPPQAQFPRSSAETMTQSISSSGQDPVRTNTTADLVPKEVIPTASVGWRERLYAWTCVIIASLGGLLFGYDTGTIAPIANNMGKDLGTRITTKHKTIFSSLTFGGAFLGCLIGGNTANIYGRKFGINVGIAIFLVGILVQTSSFSIEQFGIGKFIAGLSIGSTSSVVPMYIAELAPDSCRGAMLGLWTMAVVTGQLMGSGSGAGLRPVNNGWRIIVAIGSVFPILLCVLFTTCPETPQYLVSIGKIPEALEVCRKIDPSASAQQIQAKVDILQFRHNATSQNKKNKLRQLLSTAQGWRELGVSCTLMVFSQITGFNSLICYSTTLLANIGFKNPEAIALAVIAPNVVCTALYMGTVDKVGRRKMLLSTLPIMLASIITGAVAWRYLPGPHDLKPHSERDVGWQAITILVSMIIFVISYALCIGNAPWASAEYFPMEVRACGATILAMCNWGSNIIVAATFLPQFENTGPVPTYAYYAVLCFLALVFVYFCYPETRNMSLDDIGSIFQSGYCVRDANMWQKKDKEKKKKHAHGEQAVMAEV